MGIRAPNHFTDDNGINGPPRPSSSQEEDKTAEIPADYQALGKPPRSSQQHRNGAAYKTHLARANKYVSMAAIDAPDQPLPQLNRVASIELSNDTEDVYGRKNASILSQMK